MWLQYRWWEDRKWAGSTIWFGPRHVFPAWKHLELSWGLHPWAQLKNVEPGDAIIILGANEQLCFCETSLHPTISQAHFTLFHNAYSQIFLIWLIKPAIWRNRLETCEGAMQWGTKPFIASCIAARFVWKDELHILLFICCETDELIKFSEMK